MKINLFILSFLVFSVLFSGCGYSSLEVGTSMQKAKKAVAKGEVNRKDKWGLTPLHHASEKGKLDIVKYLVEQGADINIKSNDGTTPLFYSLSPGKINIVKYLVEKGADIHVKNTWGHSSLYSACSYGGSSSGTLDIVKYLIEQGADVNVQTNNKLTPLHGASKYKNLDILKHLIDKGADINVKDSNGQTPLYSATVNINIDNVKYLIDKGADVSIKTNKGKTALDIAKKGKELNSKSQYKVYRDFVPKYIKIIAFLKEASNPIFKKEKADFKLAKKENSIRSYEQFIASYPASKNIEEANILAEKKRQEMRDNPEKQKKILDTIVAYLENKDVDGLLKYANTNPEVMDFAHNSPRIYLLFTGPKELQVGKILQYKKQGLSDIILSSKIKNLNKPYRKFTLDEMQILINLGLSDKLLAAMLDVTTDYDKEHRQQQAQINLLKEQERIAKENKSTTTNIHNTQAAQGSTIGDKIVDKVAEKAIEGLIRSLF